MKIVISETPLYYFDAPTLPAEPVNIDGRDLWPVWCRHCQDWHWHGPGEGHLVVSDRMFCVDPYRHAGVVEESGRAVLLGALRAIEEHANNRRVYGL